MRGEESPHRGQGVVEAVVGAVSVSPWALGLTAVISHPGKAKVKVGGIKAELRRQGNTSGIQLMTENSIPRASQFRLRTKAEGEPGSGVNYTPSAFGKYKSISDRS
jgi:hypothetical protein